MFCLIFAVQPSHALEVREAQPFATVVGNVVATSDSGWAACDACCALIVKTGRIGQACSERGAQC